MDPFSLADQHIFASVMAVSETYTVTGQPAVAVRVIWQRGTTLDVPGATSKIVDNTLLAHLLVSEVGRPARGAKITDGATTRKVAAIETDDGSVVVCRMV